MTKRQAQGEGRGGSRTTPTERIHSGKRDVCATRDAAAGSRQEAVGNRSPHPARREILLPRAPLSQRERAEKNAVRAEIVTAPVRLLPYQRRWVEDDSKLKIVVKSRQIGYSFAATLRALMQCLERKTTWILLSKGERQSRLLMEKVQDHIRSCGIVAKSVESGFFEGTSMKQLEVRLGNGSVIYALPSNPDSARGYSGNVTLDEFAFHTDAAKVYTALYPSITRGYSLEVISTPNGQQGKFYELAKAAGVEEPGDPQITQITQIEKSPSTAHIAESAMHAPPGDIRDNRIHRSERDVCATRECCKQTVGADRSKTHGTQTSAVATHSSLATRRLGWSGHWCDIYEAVRQGLKVDVALLRAGCEDEATWQQEFCGMFVSTAEQFFPPELLAACLSVEASTELSPRLLASARGEEQLAVGSRQTAVGTPEIDDHIHRIERDVCATREFYLGIDVGRTHDRTVFWLDEVQLNAELRSAPAGERSLESRSQESESQITNRQSQIAVTRMVRTMERATFAEQLEFARMLMQMRTSRGPLVRRAAIDATGIGAMLAETLETEFGPRVEPVTFTGAVKEDLAYRTRRLMEARAVLLPDEPEIRRAFMAIKRTVTASGNLRFDAARSSAGHADQFWAKALADYAAAEPENSDGEVFLVDSVAIIRPGAFAEMLSTDYADYSD